MVNRSNRVSLEKLAETTERTAEATEELADQTDTLVSRQGNLISNTARTVLGLVSLSAVMGIVNGDSLDAARQAGALSSAYAESENSSDRLAISLARLRGELGRPVQRPKANVQNYIADNTNALADFLQESKTVSGFVSGGLGLVGLAAAAVAGTAAFLGGKTALKVFLQESSRGKGIVQSLTLGLRTGTGKIKSFNIGTSQSNILTKAVNKTFGASVRVLGRFAGRLGLAGAGLGAFTILTGAQSKSQADLNKQSQESIAIWNRIPGPVGNVALAMDQLEIAATRAVKIVRSVDGAWKDNTRSAVDYIAKVGRGNVLTAPFALGTQGITNTVLGPQRPQVLPGRELPNNVPNNMVPSVIINGDIITNREFENRVIQIMDRSTRNSRLRNNPSFGFVTQ